MEQHPDPARLPRAQQAHHVLQAVGQPEADAVAREEPLDLQVGGETGGPVGEVGVAQLLVVQAQRDLPGVLGRGAAQQGGDVHEPAPSTTASTWPLDTWSPGATRIPVTVPSTGARTVCSISIASRTTSACPAVYPRDLQIDGVRSGRPQPDGERTAVDGGA